MSTRKRIGPGNGGWIGGERGHAHGPPGKKNTNGFQSNEGIGRETEGAYFNQKRVLLYILT